jgi:hypothetical protein
MTKLRVTASTPNATDADDEGDDELDAAIGDDDKDTDDAA